jgi:concanavalin A-like lectin/glucanase superfamily protein
MSEWYLALTPLLLLPVFLLFHFVGCDALWGLDHVPEQKPYQERVEAESSLVAYWRLQEQNNDPMAHDEKMSHPGFYVATPMAPSRTMPSSQAATGAVLQFQPAVRDPAPPADTTSVDFQGGYIAIASDDSFKTTSFTVEAWVKPGAWESPFAHAAITLAELDSGGTISRGFSLFGQWDSAKQKHIWGATVGTGTAFIYIEGSEINTSTTGTYLALTYDGVQAVLYVASSFNQWDTKTPPVTVGYAPVTANHFYIGSNALTLPPLELPPSAPQPLDYPFIGQIQDVAFYRTALSEATIQDHRNG